MSRLVSRWQVGYVRDGRRAASTRLYEYNRARAIVRRLRALGNDAYLMGALKVRL